MLFSLFIGIAATLVFGVRALIIKLKFFAGKTDNHDKKNLGIVIYSDSKRYWNVFEPICDEAEHRKIPITYYTQDDDDPALLKEYEYIKPVFIGHGNKGFTKMNFINADICLATTPGLNVLQWKRSSFCKYYVHIPHTVNDLADYRMFALDHYDAVLATGMQQKPSILKLEELRPNTRRKEFTVVGLTYFDSMKKRLESLTSKKDSIKKTVLVAPTWGKSGILSKFGESFLTSLSKTDFSIIVRPHPQSLIAEKDILDSLQKKFSQFEWNYDNDNFDVLNKASILISDFSGVIFDFALVFDKPVIYADTVFDPSPYDAAWLNEPLWEFSVLSKIGIRLEESQFNNLQNIISSAINDTNLSKSRKEVSLLAWQNQGNAAKLTVDYLIEKQKKIDSIHE